MRAPVAPVLILAVAIVLSGCSQPQEPAGAPQPPTPAAVDEIAAAVPRAIARDGVLTIGTDPSYPPMEFIGADAATVEGADIDLATAVATVLGLTPAFEDEAFSALPDSVRTGRIELAVSSLTVPRDKPMRADAVLYFQSGNQLVASNSAPGLSASQLCGHTVATVEGSTQVRSLSRLSRECRDQGLPGITIEALSDQSQVTEAALSADVDGMLSDTPVARYAVTQHPQQLAVAGPPFDPAPFGMLSPPQYAGLAKAVRRATQHLIDSGYYAAILRRWGIQEGAIQHATIQWNVRKQAVLRRAERRQQRRDVARPGPSPQVKS